MFSRLDTEIALCQRHLTDSSSEGTPIESILVGYVLSIVYAEFESIVKFSILERCTIGKDQESESFLKHVVKRTVRSIKVTELSGMLGLFSPVFKQQFQQEVKADKGLGETYYNNLVGNRHALAHHASVNATMNDIDEWLPLAKLVIVAFRKSLGLRSTQT